MHIAIMAPYRKSSKEFIIKHELSNKTTVIYNN